MSHQQTAKVYKLQRPEQFEWLQPILKSDYQFLRFDGTSRPLWSPVKMKRVRQDERGKLRIPSDFPACSGGDMLFVSAAARSALEPVLQGAGELLPLECTDGEFWALNVMRLLDALDESNSKFLRSSDTGHILMIHRHSFRANRLGPEIFKLSQMPRGLIYVTEAFVNRVKATPLQGLDFKLVWAPS